MIPRLRIPHSRLRCVAVVHSSFSAFNPRFCPSSLRFAYACRKRLYSTSSSSTSSSATDPPRSLPKITETTHGRTRIYFHDPASQKLKWEWEDVMNKKGHGFGIGWMTQSFRATFLPVGYPASVHPTYLRFHIWKAIETTLGSSIAVLCSQAMLHSLGLGQAQAAGGAVAIQWVLKDGFGEIGKLFFIKQFASQFDSRVKTWKMIGEGCSVLGSLVSLCTAIAPPAFFLPLASIGNALRSMHYSIWGATHTTFARNFTLHGNVGDLIGKDEAQMSVAHILGAAFGIVLIHFNHTPPYLFTAFSVLAPLHILSTVKMLKAAQFEVLNEAKLSLLVRGYIDTGKVPTPDEIHDKEVLFGEWVNTKVGKVPKITPGASLSQLFPPSSPSAAHTAPLPAISNSSTKTPHQPQPLFNTTLQTLRTERYLLSLPHLKQPSRIAIAYKSHSNTEDVVRSLFHAVLFWDQLERLRKVDGGVGREMRIGANDKPRRDVDERMVVESLNNSYKIVNEKWGEFWSLMVKSPWDVDQIYFDDKFTRYNVENTPVEGSNPSKGNKNEK